MNSGQILIENVKLPLTRLGSSRISRHVARVVDTPFPKEDERLDVRNPDLRRNSYLGCQS